ncbi:MAG: lysozyme inhibitor LprI family protein [Erythrobacter sp.]
MPTLLIAAAGLAASSALEEASTGEAVDPQLLACIDAANADDLLIRDCYQSFVQRQDAEMNIAWNRLMTVVGRRSEVGRALLGEQRAWLAYRDSACEHFDLSGTLGRAEGAMCSSNLVADRITQIRDYVLFYNAGEE